MILTLGTDSCSLGVFSEMARFSLLRTQKFGCRKPVQFIRVATKIDQMPLFPEKISRETKTNFVACFGQKSIFFEDLLIEVGSKLAGLSKFCVWWLEFKCLKMQQKFVSTSWCHTVGEFRLPIYRIKWQKFRSLLISFKKTQGWLLVNDFLLSSHFRTRLWFQTYENLIELRFWGWHCALFSGVCAFQTFIPEL